MFSRLAVLLFFSLIVDNAGVENRGWRQHYAPFGETWLEDFKASLQVLPDYVRESKYVFVTIVTNDIQPFVDLAVLHGISLTQHAPDIPVIAFCHPGLERLYPILSQNGNLHPVTIPESAVSFEPRDYLWALPQEKVVYMDADVIARSSEVVKIFDYEIELDEIAVAKDCCQAGLNSGVFLLRPNDDILHRLHDRIVPSEGCNQVLINDFFEGKWKPLNVKFNMHAPSLLPYIAPEGSETALMHFVGPVKPTTADFHALRFVKQGDTCCLQIPQLLQEMHRYMYSNIEKLSTPLQQELTYTACWDGATSVSSCCLDRTNCPRTGFSVSECCQPYLQKYYGFPSTGLKLSPGHKLNPGLAPFWSYVADDGEGLPVILGNLFNLTARASDVKDAFLNIIDDEGPFVSQGTALSNFSPLLRTAIAQFAARSISGNKTFSSLNPVHAFIASVGSTIKPPSDVCYPCGEGHLPSIVRRLPPAAQRAVWRQFPCSSIANEILPRISQMPALDARMYGSWFGEYGLQYGVKAMLYSTCPASTLAQYFFTAQECILENDLFIAAGMLEQILAVLLYQPCLVDATTGDGERVFDDDFMGFVGRQYALVLAHSDREKEHFLAKRPLASILNWRGS